MDEKEPEEKVLTEEDFMDPVYSKEIGEKNAQKHLEETTEIVQNINDNTVKQKAEEKVTNIINREKLKKMLEEEEVSLEDVEKQKNEEDDENN